jgi:cellulase/cellobiase CelA1
MILWDNNIYDNNSAGSDGECHRYIDRSTLQWTVPEIISAIMKHVDGTSAPIPQPTPTAVPAQKPAVDGLKAEYTINNWGSGYQVLIKVKNDSSSRVNTWTVKVNKKDVKIASSWCVDSAEEGNYFVITPISWNSSIEPGGSVDFGIQGNGSIGSTVDVTVQ